MHNKFVVEMETLQKIYNTLDGLEDYSFVKNTIVADVIISSKGGLLKLKEDLKERGELEG